MGREINVSEVLYAIGAIAENPTEAQEIADYLQSFDWASQLNLYKPFHLIARRCNECGCEYQIQDHDRRAFEKPEYEIFYKGQTPNEVKRDYILISSSDNPIASACPKCLPIAKEKILEARRRKVAEDNLYTCNHCKQRYDRREHHISVRHKNLKDAFCPECYQNHLVMRRIVRSHNTRASELGLAANLTVAQWQETLVHFENKCVYCGSDYQCLEHFVPLSSGGGTTAGNCVPSCTRCNIRKSNYNPLEDDCISISADRIEAIKQYLATR